MNKLIEEQLQKVTKADLSNFDKDTNTYLIPKKKEIKIEENCSYLIHIKDSLFYNDILKNNWNNGSMPSSSYIKADISKVMPKMIRVVSISYDPATNSVSNVFWSGWLSLNDIDVLQKL